MWFIELCGTGVVNRLVFDTKEDAEAQKAIIAPFLGKDLYDLKKNGCIEPVVLTDKAGSITVVPHTVQSLRILDQEQWDDIMFQINKKGKERRKELEANDTPERKGD